MEVWELDVIRVPKSADPAVQAAARNVATWAGSGSPLPAWQDLKNCPRGVVDFLMVCVAINLVCKDALVRVKCATQVTCKLLSKRFYVVIADASSSLQKLDTVEGAAKARHRWPSC